MYITPGLLGCTAMDMTRPDVMAGPIERALSPANASAVNGVGAALSARAEREAGRC
jgi:hypothetical protein